MSPCPASAVADRVVNLLSFGSSWPSYAPPSSIARCAAFARVMPPARRPCGRRARWRPRSLPDVHRDPWPRSPAASSRPSRPRERPASSRGWSGCRRCCTSTAGSSPCRPKSPPPCPRDAEDLGRHTVTVADRLGAVIADSGLMQVPVRLDDEEAIEARGARAYVLTATPTPRTLLPSRLPLCALRSSHLNSSAPLSSASLTNALVTYCRSCFGPPVGRTVPCRTAR